MITANELRQKWFEFFKSKDHTIIPSSSLVPENDASVLFTMAGMHPLVPFLLGQDHPKGKRLANVQKCIRTGDIDEVGDDTHLTFFEMLGNWSLGDYFKEEAITWSYEFLTDEKWLNIPKERLAFSVFAGDDDAPRDDDSARIWESLGVPKERIAYLPKEDNWWIAGNTGPCGPDTEMFYWIDDGTPAPVNFAETKDDKRWVEIWNDVFMQYEKHEDGSLTPLSQQNVDTGMGLDRTLAVLNGQTSVYDTELFAPLFEVIGKNQNILSGDEVRQARIICDHVRASVFIASDGVEPSNKERGYILRRLLRRALVYGKLLNLSPHWLLALAGQVITIYSQGYPELLDRSESILKSLEDEASRFEKTLEKGLKEFEKTFQAKGNITGTDAFNLYQTYGFPWELTHELAGKLAGIAPEKNEFQTEFKKHQDLSRTASAGEFKGGLANHGEKVVRYHTATHLMHKALREVLGDEVWQKGSNITDERTRFDFTYPQKLTDDQKEKVEELVNNWINLGCEVKQENMPLEQARSLGAIGLFGEKYDDIVSVYTIVDPATQQIVSREFCGGPHVPSTKVIGRFKIIKEEAISAGVRRIKAVIEP